LRGRKALFFGAKFSFRSLNVCLLVFDFVGGLLASLGYVLASFSRIVIRDWLAGRVFLGVLVGFCHFFVGFLFCLSDVLLFFAYFFACIGDVFLRGTVGAAGCDDCEAGECRGEQLP
jgi:hypothetical protein